MPAGAPWTLWRYVTLEVWRLVLITTAVLVTVLAFATTIKPLADGKLEPLDAFKLMLMASVPMLQYALPFSACFGATLAYHRLASDNEVTAAHAGGISHRSLLLPAVVSGVVLMLILLVLSHLAIPRLFMKMTRIVTADASRIVVGQIQRGQALEFGRTLVYADKVVTQEPPEGYSSLLWLGGLLVVTLDDKGNIENQISARSATVWMRPTLERDGTGGRAVTEVLIKPTDFVATGELTRIGSSDTVIKRTIPDAFRDNVKFLSITEQWALRNSPEKMDVVDRERRRLALTMGERDVFEQVRKALRESGQVEFKDPLGERVLLRAGNVRGVRREGKIDPRIVQIVAARAGGTLSVEVGGTSPGTRPRMFSAASALLQMPERPDADRSAAATTLVLREVAAETPGPEGDVEISEAEILGARGAAKERVMKDLTLGSDPAAELLKQPALKLVTLAERRLGEKPGEKEAVSGALASLKQEIRDVLAEVLSKEHERYAQCLACLVMVIVGAIMAMRLRDALPLTIYLWAFFPALATVLAISGGQQLTHGQGVMGLPVLYGGVAALSVFALVQFLRLSRH